MSDARPLLAAVPSPAHGEHAAGYHRRLALANGFTTLRQMRLATGIGALSPLSAPATWSLLRDATGLADDAIASLSWGSPDGGRAQWLYVWGNPIRRRDLDLSRMRNCPRCLVTNGIVRAEWSVRSYTACPVHGTRLLDACSGCGRVLSLDGRTDLFACGGCGADLLAAETERAGDEEIALSAALSRAFRRDAKPTGGADLPADFATLPVGEMAAVLERTSSILRLAVSDDHARPGQFTGQRTSKSMDDAVRGARNAHALLADWPESLNLLLFQLHRSGLDTGQAATTGFSSKAGRLAVRPLLGCDGREIGFLTQATRTFLRDGLGLAPRRRAPGAKARSTRLTQPAADVITPVSHASAMERLEGRALEKLARWWIDAGLLHETIDVASVAVLSLQQVGELAMRIEAIATDRHLRDAIDIAEIDRSFTSGREYRKDRFLLDLLAGSIGCRRVDDRPGLAGLRFGRTDVERRRARAKVEDWIARDAHVQLSVFNAAAGWIWGDRAIRPIAQWNAAAKRGEVAFHHYQPPSADARRQKRWRVADLARVVGE